MTDFLDIPLKEDHLQVIIERKNDILSKVEPILPLLKVQKATRRLDDKLEELQKLLRDCSLLRAELSETDPVDSVLHGIGDVVRDAKLSVDYDRGKASSKHTSTETSTAASSQDPPAVSAVQSTAIIKDETVSSNGTIVSFVTTAEFEDIPKYMRGRMTQAELNEIVGKFDEFLTIKRKLMNAPFKKLAMKDKDQVCKWKELEPASLVGKLFCQEADLKPLMKERSKILFRTAVPCLRHVHRIKEVRHKGQLFFLPY